MRALALLLAVTSCAGAACAPGAVAQPLGPPPDALALDGSVYDMARLGNTVYFRGDFTRLGPFTGSGIGLDPESGALDRSFAKVDGQISDAVSDGAGGWFVGGDFDEIDNIARQRLAHIRADGTLDAAFNPDVNGLVTSLAIDGNRLFIGGFFDHVDGAFRQGAAAVNTVDGTLGAFDPKQVGRVTELAFAPARGSRSARVYIGAGEIAAVDPDTGRAVPGFSSDVHADVRALTVLGDRLYVGGNGLIALDAATGDRDAGFKATPRDLSDEAAFTGTVHVLYPDGDRLLAGGDFNALGGATGPLVALDSVTGRADRTFTPQVGTPQPTNESDGPVGDRGVFDLARVGDRLWVGGLFDLAGGRSVQNLVAVDPAAGTLLDVTPPPLDGQVNALEPGSGRLLAGGQFAIAGYTTASRGFVAVDARTVALSPGFAPTTDCCGPLTTGAGRILLARQHAQGYFPNVRPTKRRPTPLYYPRSRRSRIRVLDAATGATVRRFETLRLRGVAAVTASASEIFVARRIDSRVRFPRNRITVLSPDGAVKRSFDVPLPGYVANLAVEDGALFAAGSFRRFRPDGQPAHLAILRLDPRTGELDSAFDPHAHGPVYDLATRADAIYFSGLFDEVQGSQRHGIAAVYPGLGMLLDAFAPPPKQVAGDNTTDLTALPQDIVLDDYDAVLLGRYSGQIRFDDAGGYGFALDAATPAPGGIVYAATIELPLHGSTVDSLSFVAPARR